MRRGKKWRCAVCRVLLLVTTWVSLLSTANGRNTKPDLSSSVLEFQKVYDFDPPHDAKLYDILRVAPNATAAQITKNYRRLSREYHPDKVSGRAHNLDAVQQAYALLKEDSTRLPYHKYGFTDPNVAVALLLGPQTDHNHLLDEVHFELLQLIGYEKHGQSDPILSTNAQIVEKQRVYFIAARLIERIRPLLEGSMTPSVAAYNLARDCDRWKRLPLGAQVIRCVGRAYRHAGEDYIRRSKDPTVPIRQQWRQAKALWTALLATGKATVTEHLWSRQDRLEQRRRKKNSENFGGDGLYNDSTLQRCPRTGDGALEEIDCGDDGSDTEEDMISIETLKARQTILTSLQVDALWKLSKIRIDQTIRKACDMILTSKNFPFASHSGVHDIYLHETKPHGWVGYHGTVLHGEEVLDKSAQALIFLGNVMVERSKIETSWRN